jgi:hypothetical protein
MSDPGAGGIGEVVKFFLVIATATTAALILLCLVIAKLANPRSYSKRSLLIMIMLSAMVVFGMIYVIRR